MNGSAESIGIEFNTPTWIAEQFIVAGKSLAPDPSWARQNRAISVTTAICAAWPYVRSSLLQELAALNKVEVLPWDIWWELGPRKTKARSAWTSGPAGPAVRYPPGA